MRDRRPHWMSDEHEAYAETCRHFFEAELVPHVDRWRAQGIVDREFWAKAGAAGLIAASLPEAYGGAGASHSFDALMFLEHARTGDTSWGCAVQNIVCHYVLSYGTDDQKARWLPRLASGEWVGALAMSEPGAGSDVQAIATSAESTADGFSISGSKTFISNGQHADLVLVACKTNKAGGSHGISLIGVETSQSPGFRRGRNLQKLGLKGQDTSELFFESVHAPSDNLLGGQPGKGFHQLMNQLPWERLIIAIIAVGRMDYVLAHTLDYVKSRKVFGQRLMDLQNTRFKLAEARTKAEVTRSFVYDCIGRADEGTLDAETASMAKLWGSEMDCQVADECLQLFGGYGYMMEYPIASAFADARVQKIHAGANEVMKELIARDLDD